MEFLRQQEETVTTKSEIVPVTFPVVSVENSYSFNTNPPYQEGVIVHFLNVHSSERKNRYVLLKDIAGLGYIFRLGETSTNGVYGFSFKTEEYELATINLDDEGYEELAQTINAFLESVYLDEDSTMKEIHISPADTTYSANDIEGCMEEILKSPENKLSREELMREHKGFEIFRLYTELFDKEYEEERPSGGSRASARARFFKMMFRKNLPNWEIEDTPGLTNDFELIRKIDK